MLRYILYFNDTIRARFKFQLYFQLSLNAYIKLFLMYLVVKEYFFRVKL